MAQWVFWGVYLAGLGVAGGCYRRAEVRAVLVVLPGEFGEGYGGWLVGKGSLWGWRYGLQDDSRGIGVNYATEDVLSPRTPQAPPYLLPLLILSKRLHSLFVLRLFNDCFAAGALFLAIYLYQKRLWTLGSIVFSLGVGVKMSLLLALPGVVMILGLGMDVRRALRQGAIMMQIQVSWVESGTGKGV